MATRRQSKPVHLLQVSDLQANPVWQFVASDVPDETYVRPVAGIPVDKLMGRIVGTQVLLANGGRVWALIGNVHPDDPRFTEHFVSLSFECNGQWFHLARYHDFDYVEHGPALAAQGFGEPGRSAVCLWTARRLAASPLRPRHDVNARTIWRSSVHAA